MQVDSLELQISTNADAAANSIRNLRDALKGIRSACTSYAKGLETINSALKNIGTTAPVQDALSGIADGMQEIEGQAADLSEQLPEISDDIKDVGKEAKKSQSGLSIFFKQLKRIAVYRLIRSALKLITNMLKEGIENVAKYDNAMGNIYGYNQSLSALQSKWIQLKNTMGVFAANIVKAVTPALTTLMNVLYRVVDAINAVIAAWSGKSSYLSTNSDYWENYADSIDTANSSAKALKKTLFGFDELNVLNGESSSGSTETNYTDMFTEVKVPTWITDNLKEIKDLVEAIGAGILAWKISSALGKDLKTCAGLFLTVAGTVEFVKSAIDILNNGADLSNVITAILGATAVVLGLKIAFGTLTAACAGVVAGIALVALGLADFIKQGELTHENTLLIVAGLGMLTLSLVALGNPIAAVVTAVAMAAVGIIGYWDEIKDGFNQLIYNLKLKWNEFANWFNNTGLAKLFNIELKTFTLISAAKEKYLNFKALQADRFASGGMPDEGSLFIAGEAGPELVTQIGGRSTVYNEEQLGNSLAYANEGVISAINTLIGVVRSKSNNVQISASDIRRAVNSSNMRLGV